MTRIAAALEKGPVLGLRENLAQFSLLVLGNAFVGGIVGLPITVILMWAPSWGWITVANFLLGINQGLCWSTTVIMKIDLVGPQRRGVAVGVNEVSGYLAVFLAGPASGANA